MTATWPSEFFVESISGQTGWHMALCLLGKAPVRRHGPSQHWLNAGPTSQTLDQHWASVGSVYRSSTEGQARDKGHNLARSQRGTGHGLSGAPEKQLSNGIIMKTVWNSWHVEWSTGVWWSNCLTSWLSVVLLWLMLERHAVIVSMPRQSEYGLIVN